LDCVRSENDLLDSLAKKHGKTITRGMLGHEMPRSR
jgi:hypothetical protein